MTPKELLAATGNGLAEGLATAAVGVAAALVAVALIVWAFDYMSRPR